MSRTEWFLFKYRAKRYAGRVWCLFLHRLILNRWMKYAYSAQDRYRCSICSREW